MFPNLRKVIVSSLQRRHTQKPWSKWAPGSCKLSLRFCPPVCLVFGLDHEGGALYANERAHSRGVRERTPPDRRDHRLGVAASGPLEGLRPRYFFNRKGTRSKCAGRFCLLTLEIGEVAGTWQVFVHAYNHTFNIIFSDCNT